MSAFLIDCYRQGDEVPAPRFLAACWYILATSAVTLDLWIGGAIMGYRAGKNDENEDRYCEAADVALPALSIVMGSVIPLSLLAVYAVAARPMTRGHFQMRGRRRVRRMDLEPPNIKAQPPAYSQELLITASQAGVGPADAPLETLKLPSWLANPIGKESQERYTSNQKGSSSRRNKIDSALGTDPEGAVTSTYSVQPAQCDTASPDPQPPLFSAPAPHTHPKSVP
ncbi:hypothetical protein BKA70DRAFT_1576518 [Coprinopsis sp. MPI-PUGE-AT-0042]|nr:hypothetical protein BKA70DRAFT_1576518 [Coprinopsis sp. MPI-PUGE-AT-0042]